MLDALIFVIVQDAGVKLTATQVAVHDVRCSCRVPKDRAWCGQTLSSMQWTHTHTHAQWHSDRCLSSVTAPHSKCSAYYRHFTSQFLIGCKVITNHTSLQTKIPISTCIPSHLRSGETAPLCRIESQNTGSSEKMDGIWNRYNLKSTRRIYTFGVLKCSEKFKVLDLCKLNILK